MANKRKFYVVWKGRRTGVFTSWEDCSAAVTGYRGAAYKAFDSRAEAEGAFRQPYTRFAGRPATMGKWRRAKVKPLLPSVCVDAACAGAGGPLEFRGVVTDSGEQIFRQGPFAGGTNNVGEFLAVVHALAWLKAERLDWPVYSDSANALTWIKAGKCNTRLKRTAANATLFARLARTEAWLAEQFYQNKVLKWDTEKWGEIPADFGRK
jgi:ribonuclease HI